MFDSCDCSLFHLLTSGTFFGFVVYFCVGTVRHLLSALPPALISRDDQVDWKLHRTSLEQAYKHVQPGTKDQNGTLLVPGYQYGRYTKAIKEVNVQSEGLVLGWLPSFRLKEWVFHSVTDNKRWFIGLFIVRLGFASQGEVYVIDLATKTKSVYSLLLPLNIFSTHSPSTLTGVSSWHPPAPMSLLLPPSPSSSDSRPHLDIHNDSLGYNLSINLPLTSKTEMSTDYSSHSKSVPKRTGRIVANFTLFREPESLAVLYPLGPNRAAHTHKASSLRARGSICTDGDTWNFTSDPNTSSSELANSSQENPLSFGTMDWTRSYALRETKWHWVCFTGLIKSQQTQKNHIIGVNASTQVYSDKENGLWLDEKLHLLGPFTITKTNDLWEIEANKAPDAESEVTDVSEVSLRLKFTALEAESIKENFVVIQNSFSQFFGQFNGSLTIKRRSQEGSEVYTIENLCGVTEQHHTVW